MFVVLQGMNHLEGVFVGEDGEVGLRLKEEYVAAILVFADTLDAFAGHSDAALAVGEGEEFVAGAVEDELVALVGHEFGAVLEEDDGLVLALSGHAGDVVDGDELVAAGEAEEYLAVVHVAVVPAFTDGEGAFLEEFVVAVLEAVDIPAFAGEEACVVVFHKTSLETSVDIVAGDVAFFADAFPPASMAVVVEPIGHFGGVAVTFVDDVDAVFDAHVVGSLLDKASVLGIEFPEAVAVALVVFATGEEVPLLVVGLVEAAAAGFGVCVADADGAVVIEVGEGAGLEAVDEVAFEDFGTVLVGANPVALTASLLVGFVLCDGADGCEHHGRGKEEKCFFHR